MVDKEPQKKEMSVQRLEALTDGIFAFSMTLLVISIALPDVNLEIDAKSYLLAEYHNFLPFVLSFLFIAFFWLIFSQQSHHIKVTSSFTDVLTIIILLFVVLIPFSTSLVNHYPNDFWAGLFFNCNLLILSLLLALNWWYCRKAKFMDQSDGNATHLAAANLGVYSLPFLPLSALLIGFFSVTWSLLVYLLIPVLLIVTMVKRRR
jgi:uncharacterized membrane protein